MAISIFSQLPDDILKHIGEYWSDKKESIYRRIWNVLAAPSRFQHIKDAKIFIKKAQYPLPAIIKELGETNGWFNEVVPAWEVKITKSCCILNRPTIPKSNQRFNFTKKTAQQYDEFLRMEVGSISRSVLWQWDTVLKKQYPAIWNIANKEMKEWKKKKQLELKQKREQEEKELDERLRQEHLHRVELIKHFGTLPQYITSL
jgi:hypothetical protein